MQVIDGVFYIAILVMSIVIHEVMHGFAAEYFGDKTARFAGRLTLNPIAHIDLFGSIILPALLLLTNSSFLFGWAKPVPYNPDNFSSRKWGTLAVASAGVLSNILIAVIFGLVIRFSFAFGYIMSDNFYSVTSLIVLLNLALAIFNLVPIPPLDGSKILLSFLPRSSENALAALEQYSFFLLIIFIIFFSSYLSPVLYFSFEALTGLAF